jgi:hypothetical protein
VGHKTGAMRTSENSFKANFYEKALFVKGDVATAPGLRQLLCALRALCFYPHFRGALFGGSVHYGIRLHSGSTEALQSSERPSRRVGQVRMAHSPHIGSEALSRLRAVAIRRSLGSPLCQSGLHLLRLRLLHCFSA